MSTGTESAPRCRRTPRRPLAVLALAAPLLLVIGLAACGDDDDTFAPPDVTIGPTSYQTVPVVPTTPPAGAPVGTGVPGETFAGTQDYVIESGDALSAIAARYEVEMQDICAVNNWSDCESHQLFAGDTIKIPPGAVVPSEEDEETAETDAEDEEADVPGTDDEGEQLCPDGEVQGTYTIVEGDFQGRVADKTDFTLDQLAEANVNNPAWNSFPIGAEILLPCEDDSSETSG